MGMDENGSHPGHDSGFLAREEGKGQRKHSGTGIPGLFALNHVGSMFASASLDEARHPEAVLDKAWRIEKVEVPALGTHVVFSLGIGPACQHGQQLGDPGVLFGPEPRGSLALDDDETSLPEELPDEVHVLGLITGNL